MTTTATQEELAQMKGLIVEVAEDLLKARGIEDGGKFKAQLDDLVEGAKSQAELKERLSVMEKAAQDLADDLEQAKKDAAARVWANSDDKLRLQGTGIYGGMDMATAQAAQTYYQAIADNQKVRSDKPGLARFASRQVDHLKDAFTVTRADELAISRHFDATVKRMEVRGSMSPQMRAHLNDLHFLVMTRNERDNPWAGLWDGTGFNLNQAWTTTDDNQGGDNYLAPETAPYMWMDVLTEPSILNRLVIEPMSRGEKRMRRWENGLFETWRRGAESNPNASYQTGNYTGDPVMLKAAEAHSPQFFSQSLLEDGDLPTPGEILEAIMLGGRRSMMAMIVSGDSRDSGNINNEPGDDSSANYQRITRLQDGLRHYALTGTPAASYRRDAAGATVTYADFVRTRMLLGNAGVDAAGHFFVVPNALYGDMLSLEQFARVDAVAQLAAAVTGQVNRVGLGAVEVADSFIYYDPTDATGAVSATPGNNDKHSFIAVAPPLSRMGLRTPPMMVSQVVANSPGLAVTLRWRAGIAFRPGLRAGNAAVAMTYNLG